MNICLKMSPLTHYSVLPALADNRPRDALRQAQKVLRNVESWSKDDVPEKQDFIANLHSCLGNAYLDLGKMPDAEQNHQKDLSLSREKWVGNWHSYVSIKGTG